jgi:DNA-nicking Smr family endonuclease
MDEEDRALFHQAMRGVRRLRLEPRHAGPRPRRKPVARFARMERAGTPSPLDPVVESGDALMFRRESISESVFRKLRTAQYRVDGEIDLHGLVAADVEPALRSFLSEAMHHNARVVRVVHGKGRRSGNRGPILKLVTSRYLQRVGAVLAFASAREVDGGSGAILVLLADGKPARQNKRHPLAQR